MYVLVIDDEKPASEAGLFDALGPYDIGIDAAEVHRMAGIYDVMELATALKPWLLATLLARGSTGGRTGRSVAYIDPDIELFDRLDPLASLAAEHGIVITPHVLTPIPVDGTPSEGFIMAAGVYNLGFITVSPAAAPLLAAWQERLRRNCVVDVDAMLFVDQRWIDFAPALFTPYIWKDPGVNVAYWNLHERGLRKGDGPAAWVVGEGMPLRFFHFSGYDPAVPWRLSKHQGDRPRDALLLSRNPALAEICDGYGERLLAAGEGMARRPYGWGRLSNGFSMDRHARRAYRRGLLAAEGSAIDGGCGNHDEPPVPFDDPDGFLAWLAEPDAAAMRPTAIGRYSAELLRTRTDVVAAFGNPRSLAFEELFVGWAHADGRAEEHIDERLLPPQSGEGAGGAHPWPTPEKLRRGVTVVGHVRAEAGTGESARLTVRMLEAAGEEVAVVNHSETLSRALHPFADPTGRASAPPGGYDVNVVCLNADIFPAVAEHLGASFFSGRYTVGLWAWELDELPRSMLGAFACVDEVWGISQFVADGLRQHTTKPVVAMPLPVVAPDVVADVDRRSLGIPERFCFGYFFDLLSGFERKNPLGLVEAFSRAFRPGEGPVLVIKAVNGARNVVGMEHLRRAIVERPDVILIDRYLSAKDNAALMGTVDCYVSLHRSEGFGLTMAEAMALGKPVIATGYSGNLDFMDDESAFVVPCEMTEVPKGCDPYPEGAHWASPDLDAAASYMRTVYDHPERAGERAGIGKARVLAHHGLSARARQVRARLAEIREGPAQSRKRRAVARRNGLHLPTRRETLEWRRMLRL